MQIRNLWSHMSRNRSDAMNRRNLRMLVHKRAKMLRYLKNTSYDRWEVALERLGLDAESVEGELVI